MGEIRGSLQMLHTVLLLHIGHCTPIMKTSGISLGFFNAPVLCLIWLTMHAVDSEVQLSAPEMVTGVYGGSVTVRCQYSDNFREYTKYWCKGPVYDSCKIVAKTPRRRPHDRITIADDKEAGVFTVTMTSLRESDKDKYWCVISRSGRNTVAGVKLRLSNAVITTTSTTTAEPSQILVEDETSSWWATLRWILFILLLCCLVSTHIATWRIRTMRLQQQFQHSNSYVYE